MPKSQSEKGKLGHYPRFSAARVTSLSGAARNGVVFGTTDDGCTIQLSEGRPLLQ
jgi:hypothetical protein